MKTALEGVQSPKLEVRQVTIKGDRASAKVHTTAANQQASDDTVALVREGDDWKIGAPGRAAVGRASPRARRAGRPRRATQPDDAGRGAAACPAAQLRARASPERTVRPS